MISSAGSSTDKAVIVYDGDCVFCQNYVRLVRLREAVGPVELVDARSGDPRVADFQRQGFDLNAGMLFIWKGQVHHGDDAVHLLGGLSTNHGWFNKVNRAIFSSRTASTLLYPILKLGRRATLALRGKGLIPHP